MGSPCYLERYYVTASVCTSVRVPGPEFSETTMGNFQNIVIASDPPRRTFSRYFLTGLSY